MIQSLARALLINIHVIQSISTCKDTESKTVVGSYKCGRECTLNTLELGLSLETVSWGTLAKKVYVLSLIFLEISVAQITIDVTIEYSDSCEGRCDHRDFATCQCDAECHQFGDCCFDYHVMCGFRETEFNQSIFQSWIEPMSYTCNALPIVGNLQLVQGCPSSWKESYMRSRCLFESNGMPVFDKFGYNFRNVFCALCHYRKINQIQPF